MFFVTVQHISLTSLFSGNEILPLPSELTPVLRVQLRGKGEYL